MDITTGTKLSLICEELKLAIDSAYNQGVTIPEAERLAARTLTIRLELADEIKITSIDSKMKKHGVKAARGKCYMDIVAASDGKKPTEAAIEAQTNLNGAVGDAESEYAIAEADLYHLMAYADIFKDAHIHFRAIAKGSFEG